MIIVDGVLNHHQRHYVNMIVFVWHGFHQNEMEYSWETAVPELHRLIYLGLNFCINDESMTSDEAARYTMSGQLSFTLYTCYRN